MAARDSYRTQVELLIRCLPAVASAPDFALKGGTATNLFLRDMPRLSVDIDLTYLPMSDRDAALTGIRAQLDTIAKTIQRSVPGAMARLVGGDAPKLIPRPRRTIMRNDRGQPAAIPLRSIPGA